MNNVNIVAIKNVLPIGNPFTNCCDPQCKDPAHLPKDSSISSQKVLANLHFSLSLKDPLANLPCTQGSKKRFIISFPVIEAKENEFRFLPTEVIIKNILFNCSIKDIISFSKTCKNFRNISLDNSLWKPFFIKMFLTKTEAEEPFKNTDKKLISELLNQEEISKNYFCSLVNHKKIISTKIEECEKQDKKFNEKAEYKHALLISYAKLRNIANRHNDPKTYDTITQEAAKCLDEFTVLKKKQLQCKMNVCSYNSIRFRFQMFIELKNSPNQINESNKARLLG